ncbi:MAG: hypothetical protein JO060_07480 [Candidatus Eremiobacteraeota bacterium]|nr:hypothetical protein [Candidatus Eremiobacteraeota bacterium]
MRLHLAGAIALFMALPALPSIAALAPLHVARPQEMPARSAHAVGLAKVLTTADGGQVFGFDINHNGNDGALASAQTVDSQGNVRVSVETFDQNTGKITSSFAKSTGKRNDYALDGIFANDVALVTHFVTPKGSIFAKRFYDVMNPVTAEKFTGSWTPPIKDIDVQQTGRNQVTVTSLLFAIELKNQDNPLLVVSDIGTNSVSKVVHLDPNVFCGCNSPQVDQDYVANQAVIAMSPDGGRVGGSAPVNVLVDLNTGKQTQFNGLNGGMFGSGFVDGLAVDSTTHVAATTTELNAQVEFYDLKKQIGIGVQLPCTGSTSQFNHGGGITADPVNKLFLVTEQNYCSGSQGSAIIVYDEKGKEIEAITGFAFPVIAPGPAINPSKRMGWALGPKTDQLQQFFY